MATKSTAKTANKTFARGEKSAVLLQMLKRKRGATVEEAADKLSSSPRAVRGLIDSLRTRGEDIVAEGEGRFKLH